MQQAAFSGENKGLDLYLINSLTVSAQGRAYGAYDLEHLFL